MSSQRLLVMMVVQSVLLIAGCRSTRHTLVSMGKDDQLIYAGRLEQQEIRVGSKAGGRVSEVLVREGEVVKPGQPLIRFETSELQTLVLQAEYREAQQAARLARLERGARPEERAQAQAAAAAARAGFEAVKNWPRAEEISQVKSGVEAGEAELEQARTVFERVKLLRESGDISQQEFDSARFRLEQVTARVEIERRRLEIYTNGSRTEEVKQVEERYRQAREAEQMVLAGPRLEEIAEARALLAESRARLEQVRLQLAEGTVTAPTGARIEVVAVRPGDLLPPNQAVARLLEEDRLWVRIFVPEPQLGLIQVGQQCAITIDSFTDRTFTGSIEQINSLGEFNPRNIQSRDERNHQVFGVRVRIDNRDRILKSGMAAEVRVLTEPGTSPK